MKKLACIADDPHQIYDEIAESKQNPRKTILKKLKPIIGNCYNAYINSFNFILSYNSPLLSKEQEKDLKHCYDNKTTRLCTLKTDIKKQTIKILKEKLCPYCLVDTPTTYDHYLPKEEYPEFSVLSNNLIMACAGCNQKKSDYWKYDNNQSRAILHFYQDIIPNTQFLFADLIYTKGNVPSMKYSTNYNLLPANIRQIAEGHFNRLELLAKYSDHLDHVLTELMDRRAEEHHFHTLTRHQIICQLQNISAQLKNRLGNNYWKAIAYDAISRHQQFLDDFISGEEFRLI
ncbi:MAG: hypothetical protein HFJ82_02710 [Alistipes sp.]|jgi:hypothetical protein|uniref:HNH endonuclease n=1 Tax=uncultured Alistipes sp. TaxID=538949 RepID=UPI00259680AF|nr:hypothetical protein [uncultured Alistipes sp.]MCI9244404.1 hypothetical protein [Alistipes sp.]